MKKKIIIVLVVLLAGGGFVAKSMLAQARRWRKEKIEGTIYVLPKRVPATSRTAATRS